MFITILQSVVTLPDPLQIAITAGIIFAIGWLFAQAGNAMPWFTKLFGKYQDEVAIAVAGFVVRVIQDLLNMIPPSFEGIAAAILTLIVSIFSAITLFKLLGKVGVKSFRA